jgi:hypothetical protein
MALATAATLAPVATARADEDASVTSEAGVAEPSEVGDAGVGGADAEAMAVPDAAPAAAVDAGAEGGAPSVPTPSPLPAGLSEKQRLREDDYARKKEGGYFTGLPIANYDPTTLVGVGGRLYYYFDGERSDPRFAYTPYLHRLIAQVFVSTAGAQDQLLDYDAPLFLGSLYRVRATLEYEAANAWPYFGTGTRSLAPLSFPGAPGMTFSRASAFDDAKRRVQADGTAYTRYNEYILRRPTMQLGVERLLLGGRLRPFLGVGLSYADIHDYSGRSVDAIDSAGNKLQAQEGTTLLASDCAAHLINGCSGGFDNVLRVAVSYDSRDLEPDPNSGVYAELSTEIGTKALGSKYDYLRTLLSVRYFYSPIPKLADLVVAVRGLYEVQSISTPFFSQQILPFIDDNHAGLGGLRTLRGFTQNRFVGPVIALTNYELRWTFAHVNVLNQDFGLIAVPFLDIGRVFDRVAQTTLRGWKRTQGGGFRIAWNEATVISADLGFSVEDVGLYINFNHIF